MKYDLIIIGGGPAGLSAALYSLRAKLNVLLIEKEGLFAKVSKIHSIENYPGFTSISGTDLTMNFVEQIEKLNLQVAYETVNKIEDKMVYTDKNSYETRAILIATGTKERKLDLPYASDYTGKGISYCATCDGFFFRNKDVIVIGDNNTALEESLYLSDIVNKVTVICRHNELNGEELIKEKVLNKDNIEIIYEAIPKSLIIENETLNGLTITKDNQTLDIYGKAVFPYLSNNPSLDFLDPAILSDKGYIMVNPDMSTAFDGVFAAGDCVDKNLRQIVTACADGANAASSIIKYLK